jgi:hypothetical protein
MLIMPPIEGFLIPIIIPMSTIIGPMSILMSTIIIPMSTIIITAMSTRLRTVANIGILMFIRILTRIHLSMSIFNRIRTLTGTCIRTTISRIGLTRTNPVMISAPVRPNSRPNPEIGRIRQCLRLLAK